MNDIFLRACRGEEVPYTPVWIMRQAGRYLPEYQRVREEAGGFLKLCKTPELAAEVTTQPVDVLGVDAAILFSDILIPVEAMGMHLEFSEDKGPVLHDPIRTKSAVDRLVVPDTEDSMPFVVDTIKILRKRLAVPLIGFSGAPFTLATYMIEGKGSKDFVNTKRLMFQNPGIFSLLMEKITMTVVSYLSAQIRAGAQAVQLFDTWAGVLSPLDYRNFAQPYLRSAVAELRKEGVPIIYFVNDCGGLLGDIKKCGADVIGVDWRTDLRDAIKKIGKKCAVQGNLDPLALFLPKDEIEDRVKEILWKGEFARGHIFNLGHGIHKETPVDKVVSLVEAVHRFSER
ncbi:MAG: uroporphyrinogen decarboxylase [Nitrospirae bacterium]|nr:uroporphyrinogen decarboxylase [Nitrospirota bacterium]